MTSKLLPCGLWLWVPATVTSTLKSQFATWFKLKQWTDENMYLATWRTQKFCLIVVYWVWCLWMTLLQGTGSCQTWISVFGKQKTCQELQPLKSFNNKGLLISNFSYINLDLGFDAHYLYVHFMDCRQWTVYNGGFIILLPLLNCICIILFVLYILHENL